MKRHLLHYGFLVPLFLFITHQVLQKLLGVTLPFADSFLDPFCAGALGLYVYRYERQVFFRQQGLTIPDVLIAVIFLSMVSEMLFPAISTKFIADWWDVLAICLGAGWFLVTVPEKLRWGFR